MTLHQTFRKSSSTFEEDTFKEFLPPKSPCPSTNDFTMLDSGVDKGELEVLLRHSNLTATT